jgi:membrane associated rhomboid family serine protease
MNLPKDRPILTWLLIAANIAVFEIVFSLPEKMFNLVFQMFYFSPTAATEVWRWFTGLFLQANPSHLFFNMLGLYFFGKAVEEEIGRKWYVAVYFASGLLGNLIYMSAYTEPAVGASAAVFGLLGAAMFLKPLRKTHIYVFPLPLGVIAIIFAFFEGLMVSMQLQGPVANIAHVAGLLAGAVFAFFYSPKKALKGVAILFVCVLLILVLSPFLFIITAIGGFILGLIEYIAGLLLYGGAGLLAVLWV